MQMACAMMPVLNLSDKGWIFLLFFEFTTCLISTNPDMGSWQLVDKQTEDEKLSCLVCNHYVVHN